MTIDSGNYVEHAVCTESTDFEAIRNRLSPILIPVLNRLGTVMTLAEDLEQFKKIIYYGKPIPFYISASIAKEDEYIGLEKKSKNQLNVLAGTPDNIRIIHAVLGIASELGELISAAVPAVLEGSIDRANLGEEIGDLFWYCAVLMDVLELDMNKVLETNIAKLKKRFPNKFENHRAINRDLAGERRILEDGTKEVHAGTDNPQTARGEQEDKDKL